MPAFTLYAIDTLITFSPAAILSMDADASLPDCYDAAISPLRQLMRYAISCRSLPRSDDADAATMLTLIDYAFADATPC